MLPLADKTRGYLSGMISKEEHRVMKRSLRKLANTQGRILHMIEYSISIINVTRSGVIDNRHKINKLITSLKSIAGSMVNATQGLDKQYLNGKLLP